MPIAFCFDYFLTVTINLYEQKIRIFLIKCLNGGICSNTEFGAQCSCPNGITGIVCETTIDQCQSRPCQNNGTCKSLIDKYVCLCPNGFMGNEKLKLFLSKKKNI